MESLIIPKTEDTPSVILNPEEEKFEISDRSLPENAIDYFQPIFDWLNDYFESPNEDTIFDFKLEYFNTATAKQIAKLLMILERNSTKSKITVRWYHEKDDMDMLSSGSRYAKLINVNFEFFEN